MSENQREQPYQYAQTDIAKPALRIEDMPQYAQNIYHQGKECFVDFVDMKTSSIVRKIWTGLACRWRRQVTHKGCAAYR